jgi:hypothetical protein
MVVDVDASARTVGDVTAGDTWPDDWPEDWTTTDPPGEVADDSAPRSRRGVADAGGGGDCFEQARRDLIRTPLISALVARSRKLADPRDPDPERRVAGWAAWAVNALFYAANGERSYPALQLPGSFYDPRGTGPRVRPHLEIPRRLLHKGSFELADRLAQMGNGLLFPYWLYDEVTAVRRCLFGGDAGPVGEVCALLDGRRAGLVQAVARLSRIAAPRWADTIVPMLMSADDGLAGDATGDFDTASISPFFAGADDFDLRVVYDAKLRERNGTWASRRVGVWRVTGRTPGGDDFSFGVVTPRLTVNSLFRDPLFDPRTEASAALLVRGLVLSRFVAGHLGRAEVTVAGEPVPAPAPVGRLLCRVAQPGQKVPQASVAAATNFVTLFPDTDSAWRLLSHWAGDAVLLTVTPEAFRHAHRRIARHVARAEQPDRDDIDSLLPLAWDTRDGRGQLVRVTFTRGDTDAEPSAR